MVQILRAVYEQGHLRLLDPVDLKEGQEIRVVLLSERDLLRVALADILVKPSRVVKNDDIDEEALMREIEEGFRGVPPLSEAIIEERREGP